MHENVYVFREVEFAQFYLSFYNSILKFLFLDRSICTSYKTSLKTKFVESLINDVLGVMDKSALDVKLCVNCKVPINKITSFQNKLMTTTTPTNETSG
jgi:hypothetical protein